MNMVNKLLQKYDLSNCSINFKNSFNNCKERKTELGKLLFDYRVKNKLSMIDISRKNNISHRKLSCIESGKKNIYCRLMNIKEVLSIAKCLDIDSDVLFEAGLKERIFDYIQKCYKCFNLFKKNNKPPYMPPFANSEMNNRKIRMRFNKFGSFIKNKRIEINMSREDLAKKIDRKKSLICEIENGSSKPSFETLKNICLHLNIDFDDTYRILVKSTVEFFEKAYRSQYEFVKNGTERNIFNRKKMFYSPLPAVCNTKTRSYIIKNMVGKKMRRVYVSKQTGIFSCQLIKYEIGKSIFSFEAIYKFSKLFGDNIDDIFQMALDDSETIFRQKFLCNIDKYFKNFKKEFKLRYTNIANDKLFLNCSPVYLKQSNYLFNKRKKTGLSIKDMAKKIGISDTTYRDFERGIKNMSCLMIYFCHKEYKDDLYNLCNMVICEMVSSWKEIYRIEWEKFKKIRITNRKEYV